LAQRERGLQRRAAIEADRVAGQRAAVIVEDDRQPRPCWPPGDIEDDEVELGVIGLPGVVGSFGLAAVDELVALAGSAPVPRAPT